MAKAINLTGQRFGRLQAVERVDNDRHGLTRWRCLCECGGDSIVATGDLRSGRVKSCGCLKKDLLREKLKTHGLALQNGKRTRLNRIWRQMRQRCLNKNDSAYDRYGGRGITVCAEWSNFKNFHKWALSNGYKPNLELDRIDNSLGYSPINCRWATIIEQANNKRNNHLITFHGETRTLSQWSRITGINPTTLMNRVGRLGWSTERALNTPARRKKCHAQ
jgi:hypothetical protein